MTVRAMKVRAMKPGDDGPLGDSAVEADGVRGDSSPDGRADGAIDEGGSTAEREPEPFDAEAVSPGLFGSLARDGSAGTAAPDPPIAPPAATAAPETATSGTPNWRIEVRDNVRLSVQDHGVGIPARDLDRIFERFYRVDHGRSRDTGGTGLGLSIVRHVANNHQGWVDVESREGEGSTFSLVLPVQGERVA